MDAPQIQYARAEDGVSIAYWTMGEGSGTPLILTAPAQWSHCSLELGVPRLRAWYEHLAQDRMVVRYDTRGQGMSERELDGEVQQEWWEWDLAAVVDKLRLDKVSLAGFMGPGFAPCMYAINHPEKVDKLILWRVITRTKESFQEPLGQAILALLESDWTTYTETFAHQALGWRPGRLAHDWAAFIRQSTTQETEQKLMRAISQFEIDLSGVSRIKAETLLFKTQTPGPEDDLVDRSVRDLATGIEHSRVVVLEAGVGAAWESEGTVQAIDDFLGIKNAASSDVALLGGLTVILFADIANSTALTERFGDAAFRDKARALDDALRGAITGADGTAVEGKLLGDGVLAVFTSARDAIACAGSCHAAAQDTDLQLHVGIHAGDVIREGGNVFGGAVNIAARVSDASGAGETFVSQTVRDLARTSAGVSFEDRGEHALKGIDEPQRLFAVKEA